ncbi:putative alcohol dehydrogenase [Talaromyces proteolyticus]|uniref:Alcohol dehydrogenase n=1 Tax=Talaromyces proteolyticus TaxID=1131652 RepID=A0AAD4KHM1_9EURO|nr:putative alcohol dehydrogenase [Talaromyces proteolyticus]KAH8692344.1 putative alcohol dehydrogenase [Talaromyces proteolyticus]
MARQWVLNSQEGFEVSLEYQQYDIVPSPNKLAPHEVLVKLRAASLNYRELIIAGPMGLNGPITPPVVPGCDGAGIVEAVGSSVQDFRPGDRVVTHADPKAAEEKGDNAFSSVSDVPLMLGQGTDGTLRSNGVFPETALVHAPKSLDWLPAATLTCTWTTAWNSLFGLKGREVGPGTWVLVQGTGGVSIATLQLAVAAGGTVVATTSTEEKATRLKNLGAANTINYRSNADNWGKEARRLTPEGRGFDIIVDIGGNQTLPQSLAAVQTDGVILVIGGVGDTAEPVPLFATLLHTCIVRGILGGNRSQFKELVRYIDEKKIVPVVDDVVFELAEAKDAYRRLKDKKHFSKVVIRIDH